LSLELRPIGVREASAVVKRMHRHLPRIVGGLFACSVFQAGELVGVGVASRPKARQSCDGFTVEITRIATDGSRNACSRLYGALLRASAAVGYRKALTFTRLDEPGTSLRASGWVEDGVTSQGSWDRPSRGRHAVKSQVRRWVRVLS
jgi:hypothetical protein